jgi:ArsR family transcriptional regulator
MRELIQVLKAVADKNRIRIIKMLEKKKMCVCELSAVLEITQPSVSKHLSILNHAGIIKGERNGQWVDYSLCTEKINKYASVIQDTIKSWLNDDPFIKNDLKETKNLCREYLCKKK